MLCAIWKRAKPLPDHYRFLLFNDKREGELVWNGKTSEVCNIVLPFQVIEQVDEPRAEKPTDTALQAGLFDSRGRHLSLATNHTPLATSRLGTSCLLNLASNSSIKAERNLYARAASIGPPTIRPFTIGPLQE